MKLPLYRILGADAIAHLNELILDLIIGFVVLIVLLNFLQTFRRLQEWEPQKSFFAQF
jgi:hypothetical protein